MKPTTERYLQSCLPTCMMPDGAEPCAGYTHLLKRLAEANKEIELSNRICLMAGDMQQRQAKELTEAEAASVESDEKMFKALARAGEAEAELDVHKSALASTKSANNSLQEGIKSTFIVMDKLKVAEAKLDAVREEVKLHRNWKKNCKDTVRAIYKIIGEGNE